MRWTRRGLLATGATTLAGCTRLPSRIGADATRIGFVGDVMLGRSVNDRWTEGDPEGVWGSTLGRLRRLDGLVMNLECCISDRGREWPDKTFYFRADPEFAVPALQAADASVASLANNHVLDFRETALEDTRSHLNDAGVAHTGAGPNLEAALEPAVIEVGGLTIATIGLSSRYSSYAATATGAGTAYLPTLDPSDPDTQTIVQTALERAREHDPDLVVASLHWGPNWETAPAAEQEVFARWLIERGVDVVHGHSAHVLQGVEIYRGSPIIYDAGDFVDDYVDEEGVYNKRSALFELVVAADGSLAELELVPTEIEDETANLADSATTDWVRETMQERSAPFGTTFEGLSVPLGGGSS